MFVILIISGASLVESSFGQAEATCSLHGIQKKLGKDLQVPRRMVQMREDVFDLGRSENWFNFGEKILGHFQLWI